jgi:hypothetical protein
MLLDRGAGVDAWLPRGTTLGNRLVNGEEGTCLWLASRELNDVGLVEILLSKGADPNYVPPNTGIRLMTNPFPSLLLTHYITAKDERLLIRICDSSYLATAQRIVEAGADVNYRCNKDGMTALHWTVFTGNIRLMQLLLLKGARLDIRTDKSSKEEMPLHIAASLDHVDRARTLISGGADINARSGLDETPLHIAVNHNAKQILALLLAQSPAPQILKDWGGRSPLDLARDQGKQEMAEMIEARLQQVREAEMVGSIVGTDCRENNI